jgi:hypothetical protein
MNRILSERNDVLKCVLSNDLVTLVLDYHGFNEFSIDEHNRNIFESILELVTKDKDESGSDQDDFDLVSSDTGVSVKDVCFDKIQSIYWMHSCPGFWPSEATKLACDNNLDQCLVGRLDNWYFAVLARESWLGEHDVQVCVSSNWKQILHVLETRSLLLEFLVSQNR